MKRIKHFICILLVVLTLTFATGIMASANTYYNLRTYYQTGNYTTVTLSNKSRAAYVYVNNYDKIYGSSNTHYIKLTDTSGRWLWEGSMGSCSTYNKMYLGCDHSAYRIYVKSAHNSGSVGVSVYSNCSIR